VYLLLLAQTLLLSWARCWELAAGNACCACVAIAASSGIMLFKPANGPAARKLMHRSSTP
jgi:hypothetical protein